MDKKIATGLLIITLMVFIVFKLFIQEKSPQNQKTEREFLNDPSELCENYKEVQEFKESIPVIWTAKLTGCLMSCKGAHFTRILETDNYQYPRFVGYYPDEFGKYVWDGGNNQIPKKFLKDGLNLKIYGKWTGVDADYPYTVFENRCVPFVEIQKIEKL